MKISDSAIKNQYQKNNITFTSYKKQKKYGVQYINDNNEIVRYELYKPVGILTGLKRWKIDYLSKNIYLPDYCNKIINFIKGNKVFLNEKMLAQIGRGAFSTAFDIGDGRVLKISSQHPFKYREYNPNFDIPLLSQIYEYDDMYGYIQQKAVKKGTIFDVLAVKLKMKKEGYKSFDFQYFRTEQVGRLNGRSYLLDSRCAVKQNNIKTRFAEWFFKYFYRGKKASHARAIEPLKPIRTLDMPYQNYTAKEVSAIIKKVIKSWYK